MYRSCWVHLAVTSFVGVLAVASGQNLYFNGRFLPQSSNAPAFPQRMSWASSSVYVPFQGSGDVTVSVSSTTAMGSNQLELRLDSKLVESATVNSTTPRNVSIPVMGPGSHLLIITKITEALFGEANLDNVFLDGPR